MSRPARPRRCALGLAILVGLAIGELRGAETLSGSPSAPAGLGGTLRLAVEADPRSLDPAQVYSREEAMLGFLLFDTLIEAGPDGGFVPGLAESLPVISADGLTHTFRLRRDVRFSNGNELEAEDVVYSFTRFFDPEAETASSSYFYGIAGGLEFLEARKREAASAPERGEGRRQWWIEPLSVSGLRALDRHTVQIRLNQPDVSFLQVLVSPPGGIVPRSEVARRDRHFGTRPVGTGRFVLRDWVRGARLRLVRNQGHFRAGHPSPDAVDVLVNVDRPTQAMLFERGEIDFMNYLHDADYPRFRRDPGLRGLFRIVPGTSPTFVFLNCELPPFTNRIVRVALNHAVDKEALIRVLGHRGSVQRGPLPLTVRGFNRELPEYRHDPARAREMLAEAGYPDGFETTLWTVRSNADWMKIAHFVQDSLRRIGVVAHLKDVSFPAMLDASGRRGTVPMGVWNWASAFDDPKETLDTLLNGDHLADTGCMNPSFYANAPVQRMFRKAAAEANPARRAAIYRDIERQVVEDAPWIFLVQFNTEMLCQPWLRGFRASGFWPSARLENCWIER